jgi:hypothetical protein
MLTETQIEARAERAIDRLDKWFLSGGITQGEYDAAIKAVDLWCNACRARTTLNEYPPV